MDVAEPNSLDHTLSADILAVFKNLGEEATLGDLVHSVSHKGFGFLLVILNLPTLIPASSGFVTPFGILSMLLAGQIIAGRDEPWFPPKMLEKKVGGRIRAFLTKIANILARMESKLRPRFRRFYGPRTFRYLIAPLIFICGLSVAIPLPGTNSIAGLAILMIGLGMLEEDGLFGLAGVLIAAVGLALAVVSIYVIVVYGPSGIDIMKGWFTGR